MPSANENKDTKENNRVTENLKYAIKVFVLHRTSNNKTVSLLF